MTLSESDINNLKLVLASLHALEGVFANLDDSNNEKVNIAKFLGMTTCGISARKLSKILSIDKSETKVFVENAALEMVNRAVHKKSPLNEDLDEDQLSIEPVGLNYIRIKQ